MLEDFGTKIKLNALDQVRLYQARLGATPSPCPQQTLGESLLWHSYQSLRTLQALSKSKVTLMFGYFFKAKKKKAAK